MVSVFWILFDVAICVRTSPYMLSQFSFGLGECIAWGVVGLALGIWAYISEHRDHQEATELREKVIKQEGMLIGIAGNAAGTLHLLKEGRDREGNNNEVLNSAISQLQQKLSRYEAIFWKPPDERQKIALIEELKFVGPRSVSVTSHENTDCAELAYGLKDCFVRAGWNVAVIPLTGTWSAVGASGFVVRFKSDDKAFNKLIVDALVTYCGGPIMGHRSGKEDGLDVAILIGPKGLRDI
jgi:hypothetical protein